MPVDLIGIFSTDCKDGILTSFLIFRAFKTHMFLEDSDLTFKRFLIDNNYKTISKPVRSECSSRKVRND